MNSLLQSFHWSAPKQPTTAKVSPTLIQGYHRPSGVRTDTIEDCWRCLWYRATMRPEQERQLLQNLERSGIEQHCLMLVDRQVGSEVIQFSGVVFYGQPEVTEAKGFSVGNQ